MLFHNSDRSLLAAALPPLLYWYGREKRSLPWRDDPTPYHVWISEIMLQQTRVEAVKPYYARFLEACPDIEALAAIEDDRLMKLWEGLGYYSRARNLKKAAQIIARDYGGSLPCDYDLLLSLPGIGAYTAGAISSIAFGLPVPAVDGNVLRVITRLLKCEADITLPETKKAITQILKEVYPKQPEEASAMTQALMELGATVCIPNGAPCCTLCPLAGLCMANAEGATHQIPMKSPKKPRTVEARTVLVLRCGDRYALRKRPEKGLLAGLWELPNLSGHLSAEQITADLGAQSVTALGEAKHIFTHIEWQMIGYFAELDAPLSEYQWKTPTQIASDCAVASAFRAYRKAIPLPNA